MAQEAIGWGPRDGHAVLNRDIPRVDGPHKVSGRARYTHDVRLPGMLYGRVLLCPVPHARVAVDVSGVRVPGEHVALVLEDARPDGVVGWLGQPLAAVAAETPELAEDALRQVRIEVEPMPWAVTREDALKDGAPAVDPDGNRQGRNEDGDAAAVAAAFAECAAVVEGTYTVPVQHHACLETHGVVVDYRGGAEATVYASTQNTHGIAGEAARELGLDRASVHTIVEHMGGGFGSKFGLDLPGMIACRLAVASGKPIHLLFTRKDEFLAAGNRSGNVARIKAGMLADGTLHALSAEVDKLGGIGGGAYARLPYVYPAAHRHVVMQSVLTHTDGSRAMRAPGHPQTSFGMESVLDELAAELGLDQLEVRKKNLPDETYRRQLDRAAAEIGWASHPNKSRPPAAIEDVAVGIGFAIATWGGGGREGCHVDVKIERDGSVVAACGTQDLGTGVRTYLAAIVAEELGLPVARVTARIGDSRLGFSVGSGGSVTTGSLAPAAKVAAHRARLALCARVAPLLDARAEDLVLRDGRVAVAADPGRSIAWADACEALGEGGVEAAGEWDRALQGSGVHGVQAARVRVDVLTGEVRVEKIVAVHDCGLPLNRLAVRSQINGGVIEGLSYGLLEERVIDPWLGTLLSGGFDEYKLAGSCDMPEIVAVIDDADAREVPIGVAEATIIPTQSAIANAIYNACGVRVRELPLSPDKILAGLS